MGVQAKAITAILLTMVLSASAGAQEPRWPRRFDQVALPPDQLPKVVETHPRLWVRGEPWQYGLSVDVLRARAKKEPWAGRFKTAPQGGEALALHYLATGDESVVPQIVEEVINRRVPGSYGEYGTVKLDPAIVMDDWVAASPNVTAEQKKAMQEVLVRIARVSRGRQERIIDFMHHQGAATCALNLLVVGLALHGDHPKYGGQRLNRGSCNTFTFAEYLARKPAIPSEIRSGKALHHWETGDITAFDHASDYAWSYVCGDATQAYNTPQRTYALASGRTNRPKTGLCTRSLVFLDGTDLIVFDRVNALDSTFRKAWLLHSQARSEVNGRMVKAEVPGRLEDFDGDTTIVTWGDSRLPPPDAKDPHQGRLWVRTYLPQDRIIRRIGGTGYEFWVDGANYPPPRRATDDGNWRIEVSPARPAHFDLFLHSIHIGDTGQPAPSAGVVVSDAAEKMKGLAIGRWVVLFGLKGAVDGAVRHQAPPGATRHLVVDLPRGRRYGLSAAGSDRVFRASPEGVLDFETPAGAQVTLTPAK